VKGDGEGKLNAGQKNRIEGFNHGWLSEMG
jgi:hypothetical protein